MSYIVLTNLSSIACSYLYVRYLREGEGFSVAETTKAGGVHEISSLACIRDRRVLIVLSDEDDLWTLPGGTSEEDELPLDCLGREIREELSGAELIKPEFYDKFEGVSSRSRKPIVVHVYISELFPGDILPSAEIVQILWATYDEADKVKLSDISREIINRLLSDGYL